MDIQVQAAEHRKIIKALHQYMESQGVDRREWGLIFAKAAGYEVHQLCKAHDAGKMTMTNGSLILAMAVDAWSHEDRLNV